jgi:general secretion pathway protein G
MNRKEKDGYVPAAAMAAHAKALDFKKNTHGVGSAAMEAERARSNRGEAGYTLTELLVVIVVLALIAAAVTPQILGRFNTAKTRTAQLHADTLAAALDDFFIDVGRYPTAEEGITALLTAPPTAGGWSGPYVRSARTLTDPWGRQFLVLPPPANNLPPNVVSLGADGVEGGEGVDADIRST